MASSYLSLRALSASIHSGFWNSRSRSFFVSPWFSTSRRSSQPFMLVVSDNDALNRELRPFEVPFASFADVPDDSPSCFRACFLFAPLFSLFTSRPSIAEEAKKRDALHFGWCGKHHQTPARPQHTARKKYSAVIKSLWPTRPRGIGQKSRSVVLKSL